jgi:para-nitrobenzyl esterase
MKNGILLSALACSLLWGPSLPAGSADPAVTIVVGKLRGRLTGSGGAVFKGIPFGQPPAGRLRWREPFPAKPWTGIRDRLLIISPTYHNVACGHT